MAYDAFMPILCCQLSSRYFLSHQTREDGITLSDVIVKADIVKKSWKHGPDQILLRYIYFNTTIVGGKTLTQDKFSREIRRFGGVCRYPIEDRYPFPRIG